MILRLTPKIAALVGETPAETCGPRTEEGRLRQLAVELGGPLREEGVVGWKRRPQAPHGVSGI